MIGEVSLGIISSPALTLRGQTLPGWAAGTKRPRRRARRSLVAVLDVIGKAPVGVVGVEQRLGQQRPDVFAGGGVVDERPFPPAPHETGQAKLGQVLASRWWARRRPARPGT